LNNKISTDPKTISFATNNLQMCPKLSSFSKLCDEVLSNAPSGASRAVIAARAKRRAAQPVSPSLTVRTVNA